MLTEGVTPCLDVWDRLKSVRKGVVDYINDGARVVVSEVDLHFGGD